MRFLSSGLYLRVVIVSAFLWIFFTVQPQIWHASGETRSESLTHRDVPNVASPFSKALVIASMRGDDVSWFQDYFPDWHHHIYVMDDPRAALTVSKNKGRESTAYLTYIIDNYHNLPDVMVFLHALRYQWHNEGLPQLPLLLNEKRRRLTLDQIQCTVCDLLTNPSVNIYSLAMSKRLIVARTSDGVPMIRSLRLSYVIQEGYTNVRCTWVLGCPNEISPYADSPSQRPLGTRDARTRTEQAYYRAFKELFPGLEPPEQIGVPCGAQFALSRSKVLARPLDDYKHYRQWLWSTQLSDEISGRVMEYSWHMIMGKPAVHCPPAGECFCLKYGLCNLTCTTSECSQRYALPLYSDIPEGWPLLGAGEDGFPEANWNI